MTPSTAPICSCCWERIFHSRSFFRGKTSSRFRSTRNPKHIGRRTAVDVGLVGDIKATVAALLPKVRTKPDSRFLDKHLAETRSSTTASALRAQRAGHQAHTSGVHCCNAERTGRSGRHVLRGHGHAVHLARTPHPGRRQPPPLRFILVGVDGRTQRPMHSARNWRSRGASRSHCAATEAFTMLGMGDLLTQVQRKTPVVHIIFNNESLDFVKIEMQEGDWCRSAWTSRIRTSPRWRKRWARRGSESRNPATSGPALTEALAHRSGPVVVDAVVDPFRALATVTCSLPCRQGLHAQLGETDTEWSDGRGDQDGGAQYGACLSGVRTGEERGDFLRAPHPSLSTRFAPQPSLKLVAAATPVLLHRIHHVEDRQVHGTTIPPTTTPRNTISPARAAKAIRSPPRPLLRRRSQRSSLAFRRDHRSARRPRSSI